tara:strand:+ start:99 stop:518 length:420 start_codon:yes stop_codon:yes gene_type:complete
MTLKPALYAIFCVFLANSCNKDNNHIVATFDDGDVSKNDLYLELNSDSSDTNPDLIAQLDYNTKNQLIKRIILKKKIYSIAAAEGLNKDLDYIRSVNFFRQNLLVDNYLSNYKNKKFSEDLMKERYMKIKNKLLGSYDL